MFVYVYVYINFLYSNVLRNNIYGTQNIYSNVHTTSTLYSRGQLSIYSMFKNIDKDFSKVTTEYIF